MKKLRIVFMGTPEFAVASLKRLKNYGHEIVGVVTAPDRPAGRGRKVMGSAVKEAAQDMGLHLMQPPKLKDPLFLQELNGLNADLIVIVAFRMLPEVVWGMPPLGTINLHGSLLPKYRGAAPINWAIINGETQTGVTTFFLSHDIDTGDIIDQRTIAIGPEMTAGELHDEMMQVGADLLLETTAKVASAEGAPRKAQNLELGDKTRHAPKIHPEQCLIDWNLPDGKVHDHVRGLSPYPGAWSWLVGSNSLAEKFKVIRTERTNESTTALPGTIRIKDNEELLVACADRWIKLIEVQAAGKRRMQAQDLIRGARELGEQHFTRSP